MHQLLKVAAALARPACWAALLLVLDGCGSDDDSAADAKAADARAVDSSASDAGSGGMFAIAVGENGTVLHCDEARCHSEPTPVNTELDDVVVVAEDLAYVAGAHGVVLVWNGQEWREMVVPTTKNLTTIVAVDGLVMAAGEDGVILEFDGLQWKAKESPVLDRAENFYVKGMALLDQGSGLAVGGTSGLSTLDGVVLEWTGSEWTIEREGLDEDFEAVAIASEDFAAVGGWWQWTVEGPNTVNLVQRREGVWSRVEGLPYRNYVTGISFANDELGFAVTDGDWQGGAGLLITYDSGSWTHAPLYGGLSHSDVYMIDDSLALAVGWANDQGLAHVIRWDGDTWTPLDTEGAPGTTLWSVHGIQTRP